MAKAPGFLDKWNAILRYIEDPCEGAPWLLYLELALPPLGTALLTWFSFGLDDIIRGYFRPRGLRTGRHGRGGRRGGKPRGRLGRAISRIPGLGDDVGNFIGNRLPGATEAKGRHVSQGVKQLWIVDNFLQRALFWWLVADLVTDFLYDWTSLLQQSEYCKRTHAATLYATGTGGGLPFGGIWYGILAPTVVKDSGHISYTGGAAGAPAGHFTAICGAEYTNLNPETVTIEGRAVLVLPGGTEYVYGGGTTVPGYGTGQIVVSADFKGPGTVFFEARTSLTAAVGNSADIWVTGDPT